jgi:hypothetical protein
MEAQAQLFGQFVWDLYWTELHRGRVSPSTKEFPMPVLVPTNAPFSHLSSGFGTAGHL